MKTNTVEVTTTTIRDVSSMIRFDADNKASFVQGAIVSADELSQFIAARVDMQASDTIRTVNSLRLAKSLPEVAVPQFDDRGNALLNGDKPLTKAISAFDYAKEQVARLCKTQSTWQNILGMIKPIEVAEQLKLNCSPFVLKEAMAYLETAGVLKIENGKASIVKGKGDDTVLKTIKQGGAKVNAMRPVLEAAKDKANAKAKKDGVALPFAKHEEAKAAKAAKAKASSGVSDAPIAGTAAKALEVADTAERIAMDMKGIVNRMSAVNSKGDVAKHRLAWNAVVTEIAKLTGFHLVSIK